MSPAPLRGTPLVLSPTHHSHKLHFTCPKATGCLIQQHARPESDPHPSDSQVKVSDANTGQLGRAEKSELMRLLRDFVEAGLFPIDPKRVPACINGELELPLIDGSSTPYAAKQRRFSPAERNMIRAEIHKLLDRGVIRPSTSPWAAQCLCVKKKDGTMRLCID